MTLRSASPSEPSRGMLPNEAAAVEPREKTVYRPAVPIFMYHQVTPRPLPRFRKYAVTPEAFAAQMDALVLEGYVPIGVETLVNHRAGRLPLPSRPVVLTFDDAYQDCLEHAIPILRARGFTAIFYVVAGLIGKTTRWLRAERGITLPIMNWSAVRELKANGFDCGSHGMSHARLTELDLKACRSELVDSRRRIEDELGQEIRHLAYPFGSYDERVRALSEDAGYLSACSVRIGYSSPDDDLLALHRIPVNGEDGLNDFVRHLRWSFGGPRWTRARPGLGTSEPARRRRSEDSTALSLQLSVVIPTHRRCDSVRRALRALSEQTLPATEYEVIVSIDGSEDGTRELIEHFSAPFELRALWQPKLGRAAACNAGILAARGDVVVLLDDDMEPSPDCLAVHARAHEPGSRWGVVGAAPVVSDDDSSPVQQYIATSFRQHLDKLARPDHQIDIRDVYTGNFSIRREVLLEVGLFDEGFQIYGNEDGELAIRLRAAGVQLVYSREALASQHYEKDFAALARDKLAQGQTSVACAIQHPDVIPSLRIGTYRRGSRKWRLLRSALLTASRPFRFLPKWVIDYIRWLERRKPASLRLQYFLALDYFYWLGVRRAFLENPRSGPALRAVMRRR
jgi:peptidoglycan/xylan/chitin deacetylase (PgdA/CDA1 family)